jgi:hypothetical protein
MIKPEFSLAVQEKDAQIKIGGKTDPEQIRNQNQTAGFVDTIEKINIETDQHNHQNNIQEGKERGLLVKEN